MTPLASILFGAVIIVPAVLFLDIGSHWLVVLGIASMVPLSIVATRMLTTHSIDCFEDRIEGIGIINRVVIPFGTYQKRKPGVWMRHAGVEFTIVGESGRIFVYRSHQCIDALERLIACEGVNDARGAPCTGPGKLNGYAAPNPDDDQR